METESLVVYCADVGSIAKQNFAWARIDSGERSTAQTGQDIEILAESVGQDLDRGRRVSLGFECPLFVPLPEDQNLLTKARPEDGNRAWSAGAGCGSLATGLTEVTWVLRRARAALTRDVPAFLDWRRFCDAGEGLLLWEAFVSGDGKRGAGERFDNPHVRDAVIGGTCFLESVAAFEDQDQAPSDEVYSLVGAALLRSGWSTDLELLRVRPLVVKALNPAGVPVTPAPA